jgi:hypothetical protein
MYYNKDKKLIVSKSFKTAIVDKFNLPSSITKIVQVRNPWDYVVSAYYWAIKNQECPKNYTFEDFIFKPSNFNWKKQLEWWDLNYIDNFIRYEYLEQDIQAFSQLFNFNYDGLTNEKSDIRPKVFYQELHTLETKEYIQEIFKDQIKAFNYEY